MAELRALYYGNILSQIQWHDLILPKLSNIASKTPFLKIHFFPLIFGTYFERAILANRVGLGGRAKKIS